jgi:hypothetical protein
VKSYLSSPSYEAGKHRCSSGQRSDKNPSRLHCPTNAIYPSSDGLTYAHINTCTISGPRRLQLQTVFSLTLPSSTCDPLRSTRHARLMLNGRAVVQKIGVSRQLEGDIRVVHSSVFRLVFDLVFQSKTTSKTTQKEIQSQTCWATHGRW